MTARHATFKEAFQTLQRHAETLRNQREPDLDNLLTIVTESVSAYQVCKQRIDAVEKALEEALSGAGAEAVPADATDLPDDEPAVAPRPAATTRSTERRAPPPAFDPDEEIPF